VYGKIFESIYNGTLRENWKALVVFQQLIVLADRDGVVDMTAHAIHGRTGIPLEIVEEGLEHLSRPDPDSRSSAEDGRRIVPLDPDRSWGWRLVNHAYYRDLVRYEDKRRADRERVAKSRKVSRGVAPRRKSSQRVANVAYTDTDTDTDIKTPPIPPLTNRKAKTSPLKAVLTPERFDVPASLLTRWNVAYPAVHVPTEIRAAFEWTAANPAHRKSNWTRFLVNWLKRAQDRARVGSAPPPSRATRAASAPTTPEEEPASPEVQAYWQEQVRQTVRQAKGPLARQLKRLVTQEGT
jgi:hypothetical protein